MNSVRTLVLSGGVGGAKLVHGLYKQLPKGTLGVVVNTGDDFEHMGLPISPDIDTILYTLAGLADNKRGWGRKEESFHFMEAVRELGGEDWFALGDRDLATHMYRRNQMEKGQSPTQIVNSLVAIWKLGVKIWPMADQPVRTMLHTDEGVLGFQDYFVRRRCEPTIAKIEFAGAKDAQLSGELVAVLKSAALERVIIAPSNPWLSIDPVLTVPGIRDLLQNCGAPVIAVSPIVKGKAVKGPTAKIMSELGLSVSSASIEKHYGDLLDAIIVDEEKDASSANIRYLVTDLMMSDVADRERLAAETLQFADEVRGRKRIAVSQ